MIGFIDRIRAAWQFSRHQKWVHQGSWSKRDAEVLESFLKAETGKRF